MLSKNEIFAVLDFWNFWQKKPKNIIKREYYQKQIDISKKAREIIVFQGIRRSGKSTLMNLEIKNLIEQGINPKNILFVNLEDPKFLNYLNVDLLERIFETYLEFLNPKNNIYIFLDEVQNIKFWEKWVLKFYEKKKNIQIYVTGSSSKLFNDDFATALSGRHLKINVFPLDFKEFLEFNQISTYNKIDLIRNKIKIKNLFQQYVLWGGFPKVSLIQDKQNKKRELITYFDTIIIKDICKRYDIKPQEINNLAYYLCSNNAKLFSVNKLKNLKFGAYDTIKKYMSYLKEVYLFFDLSIFSYSLKVQMINQKKIYSIDTGLINSVGFQFSENFGRLLENIVFLELKRNSDFEIFYHKQKKECDFLIKEKNKIRQAIQVCSNLNFIDTKNREITGLIEAMQTYDLKQGLILTDDQEDEFLIDNLKIVIQPIWKWLLQ